MLLPTSRESGIEFAVGLFLLCLGIGLLIPRPGTGLYSLVRDLGYTHSVSAILSFTAIGLMSCSFMCSPKPRLFFVAMGMLCWTLLAVKFVEARLWGAAMQSLSGMALLNACAFRLVRHIHGGRYGG